ncbi:hypothetical protein AEM42_00570 [Betaproteobacteria bacterium UKL13-2]|jgi:hypothetical protein|nr:hypothetical protein AEM42_00570 [Betaproteobacteria bacterium UKL13-2]HCG51963.1 hypothetical protein [Betaproteobacteria bacterium]
MDATKPSRSDCDELDKTIRQMQKMATVLPTKQIETRPHEMFRLAKIAVWTTASQRGIRD